MKKVRKFKLNKRIYGHQAGSFIWLVCIVKKDNTLQILESKWQRIWVDSRIDNTLELVPDDIDPLPSPSVKEKRDKNSDCHSLEYTKKKLKKTGNKKNSNLHEQKI